ncbi:MFS transporter [soil metagenome]
MKNKAQIFWWSLFDFANSSYAVIILAFVFAVYFTDVVAEKAPIGDFYWSLGINIAMIISAVLNPVTGAIADHSSNKKKFLLFFTALSVICTALLYFTGPGTIVFALIIFILSNIGFQTGLTFYDAFLQEITEEKYYNKVSGIGYAVGYAGSLIAVIIVFPFKDDPNLLFVICAAMFAVFSLPLFIFLKEKKRENIEKIKYVSYGFKKVIGTVKNIHEYPALRNFLLAFFFYIDAINTIIFFSGIYARKTLGFTITELAIFFLIVQVTAMIGSFVFGFIGEKLGIRRSIFINLGIWIGITLAVYFTNDKSSFMIIGALAGTFLGSTQSLSRTLMTKLTPPEIKTEFFGFYALLDKTSTLVGPLTFGLVSWLSGSQKIAVLTVGFYLIVGILLLRMKSKEAIPPQAFGGSPVSG